MSNLTRLQAVSSSLDTAINTANSLPDASGGGSVETYTLTFTTQNSSNMDVGIIELYYTKYENGIISNATVRNISANINNPHTITNIVKDTAVFIPRSSGAYSPIITEGCTILCRFGGSGGMALEINEDAKLIGCMAPCYIKNTSITLSNLSVKKVQDITYNDELLVWDFDNGCYTSAKPLWIKKTQKSNYYHHCVFENDITLDLVGSDGNCHAVFCVDDNRFEYANNCVGKTVMTEQGTTKLLSCELKYEVVEFYNIITDYHMNCFANGVLTSTKLNNIYPIEDMKFIKDDREHIVYEAYSDIPIEFYQGLRLSERKIDDIGSLNEKVHRIIALMVPK